MGRWWQIDPQADAAVLVDWTPYNYSFNNPIRYNDPMGDCPDGDCEEVAEEVAVEVQESDIAVTYTTSEAIAAFISGVKEVGEGFKQMGQDISEGAQAVGEAIAEVEFPGGKMITNDGKSNSIATESSGVSGKADGIINGGDITGLSNGTNAKSIADNLTNAINGIVNLFSGSKSSQTVEMGDGNTVILSINKGYAAYTVTNSDSSFTVRYGNGGALGIVNKKGKTYPFNPTTLYK